MPKVKQSNYKELLVLQFLAPVILDHLEAHDIIRDALCSTYIPCDPESVFAVLDIDPPLFSLVITQLLQICCNCPFSPITIQEVFQKVNARFFHNFLPLNHSGCKNRWFYSMRRI